MYPLDKKIDVSCIRTCQKDKQEDIIERAIDGFEQKMNKINSFPKNQETLT